MLLRLACPLELTLCSPALTPCLVRVGPVVAHEVASGVRDLHQDAGDELLCVDPLVFFWLRRVMSALAGVDDLLPAGGETQPGEADGRAHHVPHQRLEVPSVPGMGEDPVVDGEAAPPPRQQVPDPLLAQQPPAP